MQVEESGTGAFKFTEPDEMREWVRNKKSRALESKLMTGQEAIERFVKDGDYLAFDLMGLVRGPFSLEREIVRQRKRNLFLSGKFSFLVE
jgi:glutaconate CoA-transferase subunit A